MYVYRKLLASIYIHIYIYVNIDIDRDIYRCKQLSNIPTQKTLRPIIGAASSLELVLIEVIDPEDKPSDVGQGQRLRILASAMTKAVYFFFALGNKKRALTLVRSGSKVNDKKRGKAWTGHMVKSWKTRRCVERTAVFCFRPRCCNRIWRHDSNTLIMSRMKWQLWPSSVISPSSGLAPLSIYSSSRSVNFSLWVLVKIK